MVQISLLYEKIRECEKVIFLCHPLMLYCFSFCIEFLSSINFYWIALFVPFLFILACPNVLNSSKATVLAAFTINVFIFLLICAARGNVALLHVLSSAYYNKFRECIAHFCALLMNIFFCTQINLNHFNPNIYNPSEVDQVFQIKRWSFWYSQGKSPLFI